MINIALVSYSLPAPRCRRFMLRQAAAFAVLLQLVRALFLRIFARGYLRIVWVLHHRALGGLLRGSVRPPSTHRPMSVSLALLALRSAPPPLSPMRGRAGGRFYPPSLSLRSSSPSPQPRPSAFVAHGGRAGVSAVCACSGCPPSASPPHPHPMQWYDVLSRVCRSACSVRRAPFGAARRARGLACPLSLRSRFASATSLRSVADANRPRSSASSGRAARLPLSKTGVSRGRKRP
jgi:hypothetical protein